MTAIAQHAGVALDTVYASVGRKPELARLLIGRDEPGQGQAAAINQDGSMNSATNPALRGSIVSFYATGQGAGSGAVNLTVGGYQAQLPYAGSAPGFAGLMQINAQIPSGFFLEPGIQPVVLSIGGATSQAGVTIAIQ